MGDHVHSLCHNQIPPTSPSDKKRQKEKKKKKKRARPGENNLISFKSYHGVFFFSLRETRLLLFGIICQRAIAAL